MAQTSSIYDHLIIWPSSVTLTFSLSDTSTPRGEQLCQIILNPCINVDVMALTSWFLTIYHLTFKCDLDLQAIFKMFQKALLLLEKNHCANLFWNPCINVEVMARTSSIYDPIILWPSWTWPSTTWQNVSNGTSTPQGQQLCLIILNSVHKCRSYDPDKSGQTDGRMYAPTYTKQNCNRNVSLYHKGSRQRYQKVM